MDSIHGLNIQDTVTVSAGRIKKLLFICRYNEKPTTLERNRENPIVGKAAATTESKEKSKRGNGSNLSLSVYRRSIGRSLSTVTFSQLSEREFCVLVRRISQTLSPATIKRFCSSTTWRLRFLPVLDPTTYHLHSSPSLKRNRFETNRRSALIAESTFYRPPP